MVVMQKDERGGGRVDSQTELAKEVKPEAKGGIEKKTELVFLLGEHHSNYAKKLKSLTDKRLPDYIILEEPEDKEFQKMLSAAKNKDVKERDKIIGEYVNGRAYLFKEFEKELLGLIVDLHEKGVKIKQIDIEQDFNWVTPTRFPTPVYIDTEMRIRNRAQSGGLDASVNSVLNSAAVIVVGVDERNDKRAELLGNEIERGDVEGYVIIEAGRQHSLLKNRVRKKLRGKNVAIRSEYEYTDTAKEVFGRWAQEVHSPLEELVNLYESGLYGPLNDGWKKRWADRWRRDGYGIDTMDDRTRSTKFKDTIKDRVDKNYGDDRERLLGARAVIMFRVLDDPFTDKSHIEAVKMVNRLKDYEECNKVLGEMSANDMDVKTAFEFLEEYLTNRKR
jgi:hypothetical protein